MSNDITPSIRKLTTKSEDELREILSELNKQSLSKIAREAIQQLKSQQIENRKNSECFDEKIKTLNGTINDIAEITKEHTNNKERFQYG